MMEIYKTFTIEAAHYLPNLPKEHKCSRMHGHSFNIEIHITGEVDQKSGWVMDFAQISEVFRPLLIQLDHRCLNDIEGLENPTSENLAKWVWQQLEPALPLLSSVVIKETCIAGCIYFGD